MSRLFTYARLVLAAVATALTGLMLTATAAVARLDPGVPPPGVEQQPLQPVTTTVETGMSAWSVVAIAIASAVLAAALAVLATRYRTHHIALGSPAS